MSLQMAVPTAPETERIFGALSEGGTIRMAMVETFWATRFGAMTDRFGINWLEGYAR
jgi:PhnB protein